MSASEYKILSLDETGKASYRHGSKNFILSGIIIPENFKPKLDSSIRGLKKKYLGDEETVLHSRDLLRKKGSFAAFRDNPEREIRFWVELISFLNNPKIEMAFVIADKSKTKKLGWNEIAILKRVYNKILDEFVGKHLSSDMKGKIIAESDPAQDKYLIQAHNKLQSIGIPSYGISPSEYRSKMTCLSLVNKQNFDVDVQIADTLATMADVVYLTKLGKKDKITTIQSMMKKLIERKMGNKENPATFEILA